MLFAVAINRDHIRPTVALSLPEHYHIVVTLMSFLVKAVEADNVGIVLRAAVAHDGLFIIKVFSAHGLLYML